MTIQIGAIRLDNPVILAPMSGVSDMPFRRLAKRHGAGLVISEMIASKAMVMASKRTLKMSSHVAEEHPMAVQLAGCEPEIMAEAARLNEDRGAAIIDINFGCPAKKVTNGYAGSALMRDEPLALKIVEAVVKAVGIPVTLKMRTGWDDNSRNAPAIARRAEEAGVQMISVHGRTRCQFYKGVSDWDFIGAVKDAVSVPVVGNGDVLTEEDAEALLRRSGADGVMIGRGCYGRPWFLDAVSWFLKTGTKAPPLPVADVYATVCDHYEAILSHYGVSPGVRIARKHLGWYSKGLPGAATYRATVNYLDEPDAVRAANAAFYEPLIERIAA
jgi:tRNA-dihydrouridine synthase B